MLTLLVTIKIGTNFDMKCLNKHIKTCLKEIRGLLKFYLAQFRMCLVRAARELGQKAPPL